MEVIGDKSRLKDLEIFCINKAKTSVGDKKLKIYDIHRDLYFSSLCSVMGDCLVPVDTEYCKLILNSKFLKKFKKEKIALNCTSEGEAREFCGWLDKDNVYWGDRTSYNTNFERDCEAYKDRCVTWSTKWNPDGQLEWCYIDYYKDHTIIKFKDCIIEESLKETIIEEEEEMKEKTYKILVPISLKSIMEAKPCNSNGEIGKFTNELIEKGHDINHEISTWEEFNEYKILKVYKSWFFGENRTKTVFVEEKEKFEPFDITFRVESEDDLLHLWCRMNAPGNVIKENTFCTKYSYKKSTKDTEWWESVDREMYRLGDNQK